MSTTVTLPVPDISCGHCVATISGAVTSLSGVEHVEVDLAAKAVHVSGSVEFDVVRTTIEEAGYRVGR